ncbi:MAG: DNA-directed RNA polymerase subunit B [Candidatus Aenigmarchaeota archaeon]|nr:DNA-directed RNA polymerase subunit B [Candidatus Aenigmarchaeota archaeon]
MKEKADIYFNGKHVGETPDPEGYAANVRKKRRMGLLSPQLNLAYFPEFKEIRLTLEAGRVRRPLIIVEAGKSRFTEVLLDKLQKGQIDWQYLVDHGVIEYLDAEEEENSLIAIKPADITKDHTHVEIDPIAMLGLSAGLIPYPEYNRGDRINYGAKMIGQSIGIPTNNFLVRTDTKFNVLSYPQVPLVGTKTSQVLAEFPEGQNVVIAVSCYDGYNMEDAIVFNKSSIQRGLARSFYFRTYETLKKRYWGGQEDVIQIPEPGIKGFRGEEAYKNLDQDGVINPETPVRSDSVLVGKISPLRFLTTEEFVSDIENKRETSVTVRHGEQGVVDSIFITETTDADQLLKIRLRDSRMPEIGDKFASRHGQKGVIGLLVDQQDMPFTSSGVIPDIIFNPHAIPSRMTIGQLLEILAGKAGALNGERMDASAFEHLQDEDIRKILKRLGFREDGKEILHDGRTGRAFEVMIFVGIAFYMKLDHMVTDKIHARSRGPVTLLTKQPTEGRAKRGGLRIGEMEQQCLIGHGAVLTLKERFDSDKTFIPICGKCGLIATLDVAKNKAFCSVCKEGAIHWVETSYAFKLATEELKSMGIYPAIAVEEV